MAQIPLILAVETSGRLGSVAIALGDKILGEADFSGPMRHSAELFPAISTLLERFSRKPSEIEHIYISAGPGSFTGLRIAVALAKTMHLANTAKIVAVGTLDVIAANVTTDNALPDSGILCHRYEYIAAVLDAKRRQFFIAVYQRDTSCGTWKKIFPDSLITASQFLEQFGGGEKPVWLLGEGLVYHRDKFKAEGICFLDERYWRPKAAKVHLLGWEKARKGRFADPLTLQPAYLQRPDIKKI
ncbi:MAG: tRNA (adenosine(37)-N6)-threonylcarbamoyltransferase complex dimerization subunit type 1 TsaB [Planctomycetota bacterium]|jgi:tRNA threonylcarbamoyl adenosine modification protein YeaZ